MVESTECSRVDHSLIYFSVTLRRSAPSKYFLIMPMPGSYPAPYKLPIPLGIKWVRALVPAPVA